MLQQFPRSLDLPLLSGERTVDFLYRITVNVHGVKNQYSKTMRTLIYYLFLLASMVSVAQAEPTRRILILGDSLTAGYGVSPEESYPSLLQEKLDTNKLPYSVINAGVSGDTSAGGLRRLDWLLRQPIAVFVLALGANDGLRGLSVAHSKENLLATITKVRSKNPDAKVVLAGMLVPPSMGPEYFASFQKMYTEVAAEAKTDLIPFLLEGVAGEPQYNQSDGIHPNPAGYKIVVENVWKILQPLVEQK